MHYEKSFFKEMRINMKKILSKKWIRAICFTLAAVSLPVTICGAIIFCGCMDRGFVVTNDLRIRGENVSLREQELKNLADGVREDVLNGMYSCLLYNIVGSYSEYMDFYSEENSNYFFYVKPTDNRFPAMQNYYNKDYQYKNTGKYVKSYYERATYAYSYSRSEIADIWLENYREEYKDSDFYDAQFVSKENIMKSMSVNIGSDNTLIVEFDGYVYYIDLSADSRFMTSLNDFESQFTSKECEIQKNYFGYDMSDEQIIYDYYVITDIELEYTEYVKKELTARDAFFYSPLLKYGDIIEEKTIRALIAGITVLLSSSILLCISAGRKSDSDSVVCGRIEKIPLEILIIIYIAVAVLFSASLGEAIYNDAIYILGIMEAVIMTVIMSFMYPIFLNTIAVRIKAGIFFERTLIYKICRLIKRGISYLWRHIHIYGKYLGIYCAIIIIKSILVGGFSDYMDAAAWIIMWMTDIILASFLVVAVINMNRLKKGAEQIAGGNTEYKINTSHMLSEFKQHGDTINNIGGGIQAAVEERIKSQRMKTELITNVSHDIKTPITSIISYVDLLDKENIENEKANEYIAVLKRQSERLKKLVQDLIDASKASTGNMPVNFEKININVMLEQIIGETMEKLQSRSIKPVIKYGSESAIAIADGRLLQRCFDNLIQNIYKYAMEESRAYIDIEESASCISVTLKNISKNELNVSGDELMERFVRGDSSRNTEGSGLGLSIAKSLMEIQGGSLNVVIDGDLFKAVVVVRKQ